MFLGQALQGEEEMAADAGGVLLERIVGDGV